MVRNQTSLPDDLALGPDDPTFSYGFSDLNARGSDTAPVSVPSQLARDEKEASQPLPNVQLIRQPNHNFYTYTATITNVLRTVLGANPNRRYLMLQNKGSVSITISFGGSADLSGNGSITLPATGVYTFENGIVPNNSLSAIAASPVTLGVVEGSQIT